MKLDFAPFAFLAVKQKRFNRKERKEERKEERKKTTNLTPFTAYRDENLIFNLIFLTK